MRKLPLFIFLLLAFASCHEEVKFNNSTLEGQKDNVFWRSANAKATVVNGVLTIEGSSRNDLLSLKMPSPFTSVRLDDKATYITYVLGTTNQSVMASYAASLGDKSQPKYQTAVTPGPVNRVLISSPGKGYKAGISGNTGGTGSGLKVSLEVDDLGAITAASVVTPGDEYIAGDVIIVSGGDGSARLVVENVINSQGEIVITGYDGIGKIVSGTYKFNAANTDSNSSGEAIVNFKYGNFYIPLK
jgi:Family of unknown function (DUF6252)